MCSRPFVSTGTYPTREGNQITPLVDGIPAFRRICMAIDSAQRSVWATITFMWHSFEMPDHHGTALDVFERAAQRGIDVRLIFWRPEDHKVNHRRNAFWGSSEHFELLANKYPDINIRWDRAAPGAHRTTTSTLNFEAHPLRMCTTTLCSAGTKPANERSLKAASENVGQTICRFRPGRRLFAEQRTCRFSERSAKDSIRTVRLQ